MGRFTRIAALNRGDAAMRLLRAVWDHNAATGDSLATVAVVTDPDLDAPYAHLADAVIRLGPAMVSGPDDRMISAYCDVERVVAAVGAAGCDAVWLGWGFASEDAEMVASFADAGITPLAPPPEAIRRLGDKIGAKRLAASCGVPLAPWTELPSGATAQDVVERAADVGYPLMVKASAGGGGRGIRRVEGPEDLPAAVDAVRSEVASAFGGGGLLLEQCIDGARHLEVQFLVDGTGLARTFGVRDCTVQRRHQKVLEETPSPVLAPMDADRLAEATARLAEAAGYLGVGTAEYLYRPDGRRLSFLEVNARLQVEHTITEMVWGVDLVRAQLAIAAGEPVPASPGPRGWAVEARLCAEDPEDGFRPTPGRLRVFRPPAGPNLRVDTGLVEGGTVPAAFDSMIAKVVAWGPDRPTAFATLRRALGEFDVAIEDGATNRGLLVDLLDTPEVREASATTTWLDGVPPRAADVLDARDALVIAAAGLAEARHRTRVRRFLAPTSAGIPVLDDAAGLPMEVELRLRGVEHRLVVSRLGDHRYRVGPADGSGAFIEATVESPAPDTIALHVDGRTRRAVCVHGAGGITVDLDGRLHRLSGGGGTGLRAPGPALVVHVAVAEGDVVHAGDPLCVLEAMKLESVLRAERTSVVARVVCGPGSQVGAGQVLIEMQPLDDGSTVGASGDPSSSPFRAGAPGTREVTDPLADAARLLIGLDADPAVVDRLETLAVEPPTGAVAAAAVNLLRSVDAIEPLLDRNLLPVGEEPAATSAEGVFLRFCRDHHQGVAAVPATAVDRLRRALAACGVEDLEPGERLRDALVRLAIVRSRRSERHRVAVAAARIVAEAATGSARDALPADTGEVLRRVVRATSAGSRHVADAVATALSELDAGAGRRVPGTVVAVTDRHLRPGRWRDFDSELLVEEGGVVIRRLVAHDDPGDVRIVAVAVLPGVPVSEDSSDPGAVAVEQALAVAARHLRAFRSIHIRERVRHDWWASLELVVDGPAVVGEHLVARWAGRLEGPTRGLGLAEVVLRVIEPDPDEYLIRRSGHRRLEVARRPPDDTPVSARTVRTRRRAVAARFGVVDPWDVIDLLTGRVHEADLPHPAMASGHFVEYELAEAELAEAEAAGPWMVSGVLTPVDREPGTQPAGVVVGVVGNRLPGHHQPVERVFIANDPTRGLGALAEPECRRIIAALDLAASLDLPVEWLAVSSGARISFDSGTENLDWCAAALRRIVAFTEAGGVVNVVVGGTNVGAQSYWNAEATMLGHTRGALIMVEGSSMVLTGRTALALSGGVVAEDEVGIGGFERIMGPNGEGQYRATDVAEAFAILLDHLSLTVPGADGRAPRVATVDPVERDVRAHPVDDPTTGFLTVGEILDDAGNPGRKRPFPIRPVMAAVADGDAPVLERFRHMADASGVVAWDTRIGGVPVCLVGIESRPQPRPGPVPSDGPAEWAGATLYPHGSRKLSRVIAQASGSRPLVVLANLSGFDGCPESLRRRQLEYGAEIARAVVHFEGPIVFVVVGRYHGGAYVVFSKALNPQLTAFALEGTFASVIGGAPAATVVLGPEVRRRMQADGVPLEVARTRVAAEFDAIHTVERAVKVGSLDAIIPPGALRPSIVSALVSPKRP